MPKDTKYISTQPHEIEHVASLFVSKNGETIPLQLLYFIHYAMSVNEKRVHRSTMYSILNLMGYTKTAGK